MFRGRWYPTKTASGIAIQLCTLLSTEEPKEFEAAAGSPVFRTSRARRAFARSVEGLYPERPRNEIPETWWKALPNGWFMNKNLAASACAQLIERLAEATGLEIGVDVDFTMRIDGEIVTGKQRREEAMGAETETVRRGDREEHRDERTPVA